MRFLFQGDSITDAGRNYSDDAAMGRGYPTITAAQLGLKYPGRFEFIMRGISGNRVVDLYQRIKADFINLKPDALSILIGVNDVWHELAWQNGVDAKKYERVYGWLVDELQEALPQLKIILLEPFTLPGSANEQYYDQFRYETELRAAAAKRVAESHSLPFVKLMEKFDKAAAESSPELWLSDGVHPTAAGHGLISSVLIPEIEKLLK